MQATSHRAIGLFIIFLLATPWPFATVHAADRCIDAELIPCGVVIFGSTAGATIDGDSLCQNVSTINGPDVWYRYRPASSGTLTVTTCHPATNFDTVLSVHDACPGLPHNQLECSDDECGGYEYASTLTASVERDVTYYVRISGFAGATGSFGLLLSGPACDCPDCNHNMICDAQEGLADCDSNGVPDVCQSFADCNTNGAPDVCESADCDHNGVLDPCEPQSDCNTNGIYDICEGPADCNTNSIFDPCEQPQDCNSNATPDRCDIQLDPTRDINTDGVLDQCQVDCNTNLTPDISEGLPDCNGNGQPDVCDIAGGIALDCNTNGLLDGCEPGVLTDCNSNLAPDLCEVLSGAASDANTNLAPDECEVDCNLDGTPDSIQSLPDCNSTQLPDSCDIATGASRDCNSNGMPDECETTDCNTNGTPDDCDIAAGGADDVDLNGEPDLCAPPIVITLGDCNITGEIDADDIQEIVNCLIEGPQAGPECYCADVNTDGVLDSEDAGEFVVDVTGGGDCAADIGIDSNNNNRLADDRAADDPIEHNAPGKIIALNDDDDNSNGVADLNDAAETNDPDLVALILSQTCDPTDHRWRLMYDESALKVYLTQARADVIRSGELRAFPLPGLVYAEGRAAANDLTIQLDVTNLAGDAIVASDLVKATVASLTLNSDLDIDTNGTIDAADTPFKRTRGAYVVVNNDDDDNDGRVDTGDQRIHGEGPPPARDEDNLKRFTLTDLDPVVLRTSGTVTIARSSGNLRVFRDPRKGLRTGNDTALLYSIDTASYAPAVNGNGRRSWNLALPADRAAFLAVVTSGLYVEGLAPSVAERADRLTVSYTAAGGTTAVELDCIDITIVGFMGISAAVNATPALHDQLNNAAVDHVFQTLRGDMVNYLDESIVDATTNATDGGTRRFNFVAPRALVLARNADDRVDLTVNRSPAIPLRWTAPRAEDDHADVGLGDVEATPDGDTTTAHINTNERGSFLITCYVDANRNERFDPGEPRTILPLILVHPASPEDETTGAAGNIRIVREGSHQSWDNRLFDGGGGMFVSTGVFELAHPERAAIHRRAAVTLIGGGPTGRRGLDRAFVSWCQNLTGANYRGAYQGAPAITYVFVHNLPPVNLLVRRGFFPGMPPPVPLMFPLLDTGFGGDGPGAGLGGESIRPTHQSQTVITPMPAVGKRIRLDAVDSPGDLFFGDHPAIPGRRLQNVNYDLSFSAHVVCWTSADGTPDARAADARSDAARRAYVVVDSVNWSLFGNWNISVDGIATVSPGGEPRVTVGAPVLHDPPVTARDVQIETRFPAARLRVAYKLTP